MDLNFNKELRGFAEASSLWRLIREGLEGDGPYASADESSRAFMDSVAGSEFERVVIERKSKAEPKAALGWRSRALPEDREGAVPSLPHVVSQPRMMEFYWVCGFIHHLASTPEGLARLDADLGAWRAAWEARELEASSLAGGEGKRQSAL